MSDPEAVPASEAPGELDNAELGSPPRASLPGDAALQVRGVHAVLGGAEILRGVDVELGSGEVVGVLGASGAGKTTLFRVIAGELEASAGSVMLGMSDVSRLPLWRRARIGLGYVPQTPSVLFDLTVEDNIRAFERAARAASQPVRERARVVDLELRLGVRARELSGGERRRLEILRALIGKPSVLVLDEPLTGMDPAAAKHVGRVLRAQSDAGTAILIADHRIREALAICDRALLLADGKVELSALAEGFADHPAVRERYLG